MVVLMFFYERYPTVAPKLEGFQTSGNPKSHSARWMEKHGGSSLPAVINHMKITHESAQALFVPRDARLTAVAVMSLGWFPARTSDGALVVMPYNPDRIYLTTSSMAIAVDRVCFVIPSRTRVGSCTRAPLEGSSEKTTRCTPIFRRIEEGSDIPVSSGLGDAYAVRALGKVTAEEVA
ncbi:hypothetical protein U1Q18_027904, partial [Sarracenia purpurea var. burkii]